jgi:hypothetical protein
MAGSRSSALQLLYRVAHAAYCCVALMTLKVLLATEGGEDRAPTLRKSWPDWRNIA